LTVTEGISRVNYGQIDVELTVEDARAYTPAVYGQGPEARDSSVKLR
jgi:hypothetical protein